MKTITLEDLQKLGRLLKGVRCRQMTEQEIKNFGVIPEGATIYPDYESYKAACKNLVERNVHHQTFCSQGEGQFWTIVI